MVKKKRKRRLREEEHIHPSIFLLVILFLPCEHIHPVIDAFVFPETLTLVLVSRFRQGFKVKVKHIMIS